MNGLAIKDWDIEAFVNCIHQKASVDNLRGVDAEFIAWLAAKSAEWHQQFYALLARDSEAQGELSRLKRCEIVRLTDGTLSIGQRCHFPDDRGLKSDGLLCVDPAVYSAGRSKAQQESARKFLENVGVTNVGERQLVVAILKSTYASDTRTLDQREYAITQFHLLVAKKSARLARLIWSSMCSLANTEYSHDATYHQNPLRAVYRKNERGGAHFASSQLVHQLRNEAWVPQRGGEFVRPAQARAELLPDGFTFDPGWPWIKAIQFGRGVQLQNERTQAEAAAAVDRQRKQEEAAAALGFDDAETARKLAEIPIDELKVILAKWERNGSQAPNYPEFPERQSPNPERRVERMAERARAAPAKTYEVRERSVRTSDKDARQLARPYLGDLYTNVTDEMICQACHQAMPFNLADGSPYYEAPELLPELSAELVENHLALCPTCCAKWRHARATSDADVIAALQSTQTPEITVTLASEPAVIRFVQLHLDDLRTIISVTVHDATASADAK